MRQEPAPSRTFDFSAHRRQVMAGLAALALSSCRPPAQQAAGGSAPAKHAPPPPPPFTSQDISDALATLKEVPTHGLSARRFNVSEIEEKLADPTPSQQEEGKRRLRALVIAYARAQHGLTIPAAALPRLWNQRPSAYDAEIEMNAALRGGAFRTWLETLPPQTAEYRALQTAYAAASAEDGAVHVKPQVVTSDLEIGEADAASEAARRRLALEDPTLADHDPADPVDEDLVEAVRGYQRRRGLPPRGKIDASTAARLNAPSLGRAARLKVNLERLRWLPRPAPERRIDVNIASAEMTYYRGGEPALHMLAVSGKLGDETPIVSSAIDSIVLDPPWYVPKDIAEREVIPKGAAYMQARGFVWRGGRIIQLPGPKAALGLVKFDFPNPYAVYLHDTPAKASFNQSQRAASHGCIRLQHAVELARTLAEDEPGLSAERIDDVLASGETARLKLSEPVPVRLMYLTMVEKDGEVVAVPDVYSWDGVLLQLLDYYQTLNRRT